MHDRTSAICQNFLPACSLRFSRLVLTQEAQVPNSVPPSRTPVCVELVLPTEEERGGKLATKNVKRSGKATQNVFFIYLMRRVFSHGGLQGSPAVLWP
jgi:hypothetical protein